MADREPFLTPEEVCTLLNISRSALQKMCQQRRISFTKLGFRTYRFEKREIEAWLAKKKIHALRDFP